MHFLIDTTTKPTNAGPTQNLVLGNAERRDGFRKRQRIKMTLKTALLHKRPRCGMFPGEGGDEG